MNNLDTMQADAELNREAIAGMRAVVIIMAANVVGFAGIITALVVAL